MKSEAQKRAQYLKAVAVRRARRVTPTAAQIAEALGSASPELRTLVERVIKSK